MRNKMLCMIGVILAAAICGCQYGGNANATGKETTDEPLQMPDIVFLNTISYTAYSYDDDYDGPERAISFYDKNGDHYVSGDEYVCTLSFDKICDEYAAGKLDDKIKYHMSCDKDGLYENYRKLCKISKEDVHIVYSDEIPEWITNRETWYGLYYDEEGNIQSLNIHEYYADHFYTDNDEANEIYEWYMGTFKKNKDADGNFSTGGEKPVDKPDSRIKMISDADAYDGLCEKVYTDERMLIADVLDRESEFIVINDIKHTDVRAVYLYYISDDMYEKGVFPVDYSKNEVIAAGFLKKPDGRAYVLCPEYTVVEAVTTPDSDVAKEAGTYIPDEILDNTVPSSECEVGGKPMFRIYEIDPDVKGSIRFTIHSSSDIENKEEWGSFVIDCDILAVEDNNEA